MTGSISLHKETKQEQLEDARNCLKYYYEVIAPEEPDAAEEKSLLEEVARLEAEVEEDEWREAEEQEWRDLYYADSTLDPAFGSWPEFWNWKG
jgi:hypothetical protein